ncbi:MAG: PilZ domain-containing protein [Desulfobacteraceae bacterium]|jgi:Tfp pilus assembly protein PilZ
MSVPEKELKKYNTLIYKLFNIVLNLSEKQQQILLQHAEELFLQEKREHIRKAVKIPVYYATYDRVYSNYIKNISQQGLFIETQRPLFVGEEIVMTFRLKGFDKPLKIKGEVAHATRAGIGVEFKNTSPYLMQIIGLLVDRMEE